MNRLNTATTFIRSDPTISARAGWLDMKLRDVADDISKLIVDIPGTLSTLEDADNERSRWITEISRNVLVGGVGGFAGWQVGINNAAAWVFQRAGNNPNSFGHALEYLYVQKQNFSLNRLMGYKYSINPNSIAPGGDVIISKSGKIVGYQEVKAGTSNSTGTLIKNSLSKGKYENMTFVGSKESTKVIQKAVDASGKNNPVINSKIADKQIKKVADLSKTGVKHLSIAGQVAKVGAVSAVISGGLEAVSSYDDYKSGNISGKQYASNIARESVEGAVVGAAVVAAGIAFAPVAVTIAGAAGVAAAGVAASVAVGVAVGYGVSKLADMTIGKLWNKIFKF
jgi:hypothetical protein